MDDGDHVGRLLLPAGGGNTEDACQGCELRVTDLLPMNAPSGLGIPDAHEHAVIPARGRSTSIYTLRLTFLQRTKAVGANPYEYLHDVYNRIMAHPANRLHELLPAEWMRARANR